MILRSGWLHVGSFDGAPVRVHWTLPPGAYLLTGAVVPGGDDLDGATAWRIFRIAELLPSRKSIALRMRARSIRRELEALAKEHEGDARGDDAADAGGKVIPFKTPKSDRSKLN